MKKILFVILIILFSLNAETLFEIKDASDRPVFSISDDGMRVINDGDTMMVITAAEAKINLDNSKDKALCRSFSVTTSTTGKAGLANVLEVTTDNTIMREGVLGDEYTNFSSDNLFLGLNAGKVTTGTLNVFLGNESGMNNESGSSNIMLGNRSGYNNNSGGANIFIGNNSGETNYAGSWNMFIGHSSGQGNIDGTNNLFIGHYSGASNNYGSSNLFVGADAGVYNTYGEENVFIGQGCGMNNVNADKNTFLGRFSGSSNSDDNANNNTFIGYKSGSWQGIGFENTYVGSNAGQAKTLGYYNTFVGYSAGQNNTTNSSNTFIGYKAGLNNTGSYNVFLGREAGSAETGAHRLYIENSNSTSPLIYGEFDNDLVRINGELSIKTLIIADMGTTNLGLSGDIIPYSSTTYDIGNNVDGEYWDDVVADDFINYVVVKSLKDVKSVDSGLNKIMKLRPVTFFKGRQRFGLIPEEVEKVIPEVVVSQDIDIDPVTGEMVITETEKGMNYIELIPILIKSIQDQQAMIEMLETRIINLEHKK